MLEEYFVKPGDHRPRTGAHGSSPQVKSYVEWMAKSRLSRPQWRPGAVYLHADRVR